MLALVIAFVSGCGGGEVDGAPGLSAQQAGGSAGSGMIAGGGQGQGQGGSSGKGMGAAPPWTYGGSGGGKAGSGGAAGMGAFGGFGGIPDRPSNGVVSVDEASIVGDVSGGSLVVRFSAHAAAGALAQGSLTVSLQSVDGSAVSSMKAVDFSIGGGQDAMLEATLSLPPGLASQADWVGHVVRIDDGQDGGLTLTRSLLYVLPRHDLALEGPSVLQKGKPASYRARLKEAGTGKPLTGRDVTLVARRDGKVISTRQGKSDERGEAVFELAIDSEGAAEVSATASLSGVTSEAASPLSVKAPASRVLLTTDKPIYQPGQVIHLRALALSGQGNAPMAGQDALFEIEDGKGNKIHKLTLKTDQHGIAASRFTIGPVVNMGDFKVRAQVGEHKTEKTVSVSRYALPKFKVGVQTDKPYYLPGQTLHGVIDAAYFFGKAVSGGDVTIEASTLDIGETVFATVQGKTAADGKMAFDVKLPSSLVGLPLENGNALVNLKVQVTDTAGQQFKQERPVIVSQDGVDVVLVPEGTVLVPGVENVVDLYASDPLGAPLGLTPVQVALAGGQTASATTDAYGHAAFKVTPQEGTFSMQATVQGAGGAVTESFSFSAQAGQAHVVLRTDKAVYDVGDEVAVTIVTSNPSETVYVDWLNNGQAVDMRTLDAVAGQVTFTMPIDTTLTGANRVEAYVVDGDGNIARTGRTVYARSGGSLSVKLATDKPEYAPGEPAKLTFSVTDEKGAPAVAALGVQIVDEAVFALVDARPGLLRTYFELDEAFSKPSYEIHGPSASFDDLLFNQTASADSDEREAAQTRTRVAFAALGDKSPTGLSVSTWPKALGASQALLSPVYAAKKASLLPGLSKLAKAVEQGLADEGCSPQQYYCDKLQDSYQNIFGKRVADNVTAADFWGNAYVVAPSYNEIAFSMRTRGPDEKDQTADDYSLSFTYTELGIEVPFWGWPGGGEDNGAGGGATGAAGASQAGGGAQEGGGPRVRKNFPETLYVNPAVITGPDGSAQLDVPMADSITTWRVSTLAHSQQGRLGGASFGIKVFQDFFADINFPAQMTRGDEVTFPLAVYSYLEKPQKVTLTLDPGDWYTPLGSTTLEVDIGPGEVKGVSVPVRVEKVGTHTLTVKALGEQKSDAVARMVRVEPDGKKIAESKSASLGAGTASHAVGFPAIAVEGSNHLHLDIYPAYLSQVVSGMDSILQTPNGCFEQTTSSTWPNVLVTRYMKQTGQITPAIQMKAESLISAGYQRLLTFEHPGGGFSWFGTQDPAPFLSVTAFGVMEFADMAKVAEIEPTLVSRTAAWLSAQQQPDGSWKGDQTEFFSFQTSTVRNTAFVAWALASAGEGTAGLPSALGYVKANLTSSEQDIYTLGIVANAFVAGAPSDPFTAEVLDQLESKKKTDGDKVYWSAEGTQTDFYGGGHDADVTSTALAAHAMLLNGGHGETVNGALAYLAGSKDPNGNFGSTQATIWSLRTLLLAAEKGTESAVGTLEVELDGKPFSTIELKADQGDVMHTVDMSPLATVGDHDVKLSFVGTGKVSYNLVSSHHVPWADAPAQPAPIGIAVSYDKTALSVDDTVTATVAITNNTDVTQNMVLVTVGIAPGFEVLGDSLQPYLDNNQISKFETTGKQLILYVSKLEAKAALDISYQLKATMPVKAEDGGAEVHPYYQPTESASAQSTTLVAEGQ